jgi:RNA polymerase sigma-70 factor, ECF subfamily
MPDPDSRSDEQLVAAANDGDASAMAALYIRYQQWVYALALRFTGNAEEAADVTQEAFAYLLSKFPGLRLRAKVTTLLYPAVKNTALAMKRKKKPLPAGDGLDEHLAPACPVLPELAADQRTLAESLTRLPDGQREVLLMRAVDGMALAEIALALGIPEGTVKSRLHHAIRAMQELLRAPEAAPKAAAPEPPS